MKTLLLSLLFSFPAFAGDKINNGGGIWICENADLQITSSVLVDFYEAENEFRWTLIQPAGNDPWKVADDLLAALPTRFPRQAAAWAQVMADVRTRFTYIAGELSPADDSHYRAKPLPSLCRTGGGWQYRQFATWDDRSHRGIIRQDYWNSPDISTLDKAGLLWHEVIYRWLRITYGDKDSNRARELVGVLFAQNDAQFTPDQARARVQEILDRNPSPEPDPAGAWICALQNRQSHLWFSGYGLDKATAKAKAIEACRDGGDFMGFGCGGPGNEVECGPLGAEEIATCAVPYRMGSEEQLFTAKGRSLLEARIKALQLCNEAVGKDGAWLCRSSEAVCRGGGILNRQRRF